MLLSDDSAMQRWANRRAMMALAPFTRAGSYERVEYDQELEEFWEHRSDPRRPVIMRGAKVRRRNRHGTKSGYSLSLVDRYLRFIRFTTFDPKESHRLIGDLLWRHGVRRSRDQYLSRFHISPSTHSAWIGGHRVALEPRRYFALRDLNDIAVKADRLGKPRPYHRRKRHIATGE